MNKHEKLWDSWEKNEWKQKINMASWVILGLLTLVSLLGFLSICGIG